MKKKINSLFMVLTIAAVISISIFAQDGKKQETTKTIPSDKTPLKEFACSDDDFTVRSHTEKEIVDVIKTHMKSYHNMAGDEKEIKQMIKEVVKK